MSLNSTLVPNRPFDTPENHGSLLNMMAWFLLVMSSLAVFTRIATKWIFSKTFNADDWLISGSLVFSIGQTVALNIAVAHGLGQNMDTISPSRLTVFQKSLYAANVLWIASVCFSKLSILLFIYGLSPVRLHEKLALCLIGATSLWGLTSIFAILFQCHVPQAWDVIGNMCINRDVFWKYSNSASIVLDLCLVIMPLVVVWSLQVSTRHKVTVMGVFVARILTVSAIVWQMVTTNSANRSTDVTFSLWPVTLAMTLVQSLGIVTSCIPYLKPFIQSLESGMIRSDDIRRRGETGALARGYIKAEDTRFDHSQNKSSSNNITSHGISGSSELQTIASNTMVKDPRQAGDGEFNTESHPSRTQFITQTKTWAITRLETRGGDSSQE